MIWADEHARAFGMVSDAELAMLIEWEELFLADGHTLGEMRAATRHLVTRDPPQNRYQMLDKLRRELERLRRERLAGEPPGGPGDPGTCTLCGGAGVVTVPACPGLALPSGRRVTGGEGWHTFGVLCRCPLGRWRRGRQDAGERMLTLGEYELHNPDWADQIERHRVALVKLAGGADAARRLDRSMPGLATLAQALREREAAARA